MVDIISAPKILMPIPPISLIKRWKREISPEMGALDLELR